MRKRPLKVRRLMIAALVAAVAAASLILVPAAMESTPGLRAPDLRVPLPHISPSRTPGTPASLNGLRPKVPPAATTLLRLAAQPIDAPRSLRGRRLNPHGRRTGQTAQ
jgi:hypothetical protein